MEPHRSRVPEPEEIRRCLFVRALEETDGSGERWTLAERSAATKAVLNGGETGLEFVRARTAVAGPKLKGPLATGFARVGNMRGGLPAWLGPAVAAGAFAVGWLTHDLGSEGKVSLLAFPLLGLILWNLAVVGAALISLKRKRKIPELPGWMLSKPAVTGDALTDAVLQRTENEWQAAQAPQLMARAKGWFHIAALLLAAGVVAGMYARGLVRNYQAGWESTFLTQPAVSKLTRIVLGPASILSGVKVPEVPPQGGLSPAAPWIHLWATSAGLFILLPRLLLLSMARREVRQAGVSWADSFAAYEENARRLATGQPLVARVLPVQCDPDSPLRDSLRGVLQHLWGGQVMVDFLPSVPYGGEDECLESLTEAPTHLVMLLPMAVTPEDEVHGTLHRGLQALLAKAVSPPFALTVLDAASFEARTAGLPEAPRRLAERRAAWEKILGPAWPLLVLDQAARRNPSGAAALVAEARQPLRPWTAGA